MVFYNAVKLTRIGMDGKPDPEKIGYGLIETRYRDGPKVHRLERSALHDEAWKLMDRFAFVIESDYEKSRIDYTSLSFKAPCDLIMRNPREMRLYKVDDFPTEKIIEFQKAIMEEISEW